MILCYICSRCEGKKKSSAGIPICLSCWKKVIEKENKQLDLSLDLEFLNEETPVLGM